MAAPPCNCESECPGCQHCAVVHVLPNGFCAWFCDGCGNPAGEPKPLKIRGAHRPVTRGDLVDFEMRNSTLGDAAQLLASGADADGAYADAAYSEIFVPASRINERRDLRLESVPLDTVLRELGLTAVEPVK